MDKKILIILLPILLLLGFVLPLYAENEGVEGNEGPKINHSFASKKIYPAETWRIYLSASDSNGNMKYIFARVEQAGLGAYPLNIIRISKKYQKELSGYLYLNTASVKDLLNRTDFKLTVQIKNQKGDFSQPVVFPLEIQSVYHQEKPPSGVFKDEALGAINVRLASINDQGSSAQQNPK